MNLHEFASRSLSRRLKGRQRGEYEKGKHLIREHGGPAVHPQDRSKTEKILESHGVSSIPKEDREIGFRGPASVKKRKEVLPKSPQVGGGRAYQRVGFGVDRSFGRQHHGLTHDARRGGHTKTVMETVLNPARRRAHQVRGGPTPHWWAVKHHMPPHKTGAEPGGESSPLAGREKLNRGLGPAAHPTKGKVAYVHPASVQPRGSSITPDSGGEQHVHYTGEGNIQPLSKGGGGSRMGGTVPKERVVGIGHRAAEALRRERSRHGEELHKENLSKYKKDLERYEDRKATQQGKRGSGRGPGTGKPSSARKRIWSSQYQRWIDAPTSGREESPVQHRKDWWEDDYSYPILGGGTTGTYAGGTGMSGFGSPRKPDKPKPLSADMIGTKKGLRKKYKEWKKTGETAFHHPDGTPKSSFQPSDELIRYHTARERNPWIRNMHDYHVLKNMGKAPRLPHEGGKHPADFNEFSDTPAQEHHRKNSSVHNELVKKHRLKSGQSYNVAEHGEPPRGVFHSWSGVGGGLTWRVLSPDEHWSRNRPSHNLHEFAVSVMKPPASSVHGPRHRGLLPGGAGWDSGSTYNTHVRYTPPEYKMKTRAYYAAPGKKGYRQQSPRTQRAEDRAEKGQIELNRTRRGRIHRGGGLTGPSEQHGQSYKGDPTWDGPKLPTKRPRGGPYMHEFYGPSINLRAFRPGHLEFGGRKTGGRGKKMMMPGHYRFHDRGGHTSIRED